MLGHSGCDTYMYVCIYISREKYGALGYRQAIVRDLPAGWNTPPLVPSGLHGHACAHAPPLCGCNMLHILMGCSSSRVNPTGDGTVD